MRVRVQLLAFPGPLLLENSYMIRVIVLAVWILTFDLFRLSLHSHSYHSARP